MVAWRAVVMDSRKEVIGDWRKGQRMAAKMVAKVVQMAESLAAKMEILMVVWTAGEEVEKLDALKVVCSDVERVEKLAEKKAAVKVEM